MKPGAAPLAVSFDVGRTLLDFDAAMLARRLAERGVHVAAERCELAVPAGYEAYDVAVRAAGRHPWKVFMAAVLDASGVGAERVPDLVEWLFTEQLTKNLWRRAIPGMFELVARLRAAGVPLVIVSNSEGRLADLLAELGHDRWFDAVADSGRLGVEKPRPEIFAWAAERIGVPLERVVHVGDSLVADVEGALAAGLSAVWFAGDPARAPAGALVAGDAVELVAVLRALGLPA